MARDLRTSRNGYADRNKIWKRQEGSNQRKDAPDGVFYSTDVIPLSSAPLRIGNKVIDVRYEVTIETVDYLHGLKVDDWVEYGGEFFRVEKITEDDDPVNKQKSKRPFTKSTIVLVK